MLGLPATTNNWTRAFRESGLPTTTMAVGFIMATYADYKTGGDIRPSAETIARQAGLKGPHARKVTYRHMSVLCKSRWMEKTYDANHAGRRDESSRYRLTFGIAGWKPEPKEECSPVELTTLEGSTGKECSPVEFPSVPLESDTTTTRDHSPKHARMGAGENQEQDKPQELNEDDLQYLKETAQKIARYVADYSQDCEQPVKPVDPDYLAKFLETIPKFAESLKAIYWWVARRFATSGITNPGGFICTHLEDIIRKREASGDTFIEGRWYGPGEQPEQPSSGLKYVVT
jgi:hypothetical protein